jgi:hypothetical protein
MSATASDERDPKRVKRTSPVVIASATDGSGDNPSEFAAVPKQSVRPRTSSVSDDASCVPNQQPVSSIHSANGTTDPVPDQLVSSADVETIASKYQRIVSSTPEDSKQLLIDEWLSPRMREMLTITANIESNRYLKDPLGHCRCKFVPRQAKPLEECCAKRGIRCIEYIPDHVLRDNAKGFFQSFADAWEGLFHTCHFLLKRGRAPYVAAIDDSEIRGSLRSTSKYAHFKQKGGKVSFVLDAIIDLTEKALVGNDDGAVWKYDDHRAAIEAHPETPLDRCFDIARWMLIDRGDQFYFTFRGKAHLVSIKACGEGPLATRGPYPHLETTPWIVLQVKKEEENNK